MKFRGVLFGSIHPYPPEFPLIIHGRQGVKQKEMDRLSATLDGHEMIKVVGEDLSCIFKGGGGWTLHFLKEFFENFIHPFRPSSKEDLPRLGKILGPVCPVRSQ